MESLVRVSLLATLALARYSQKLDCVPGLDGCNDDYDLDELTSSDGQEYYKKRLLPGVGLAVVVIIVCCIIWCFWFWCRCCARCCNCCRAWCCRCCCGAGVDEKKLVITRCQRVALGVVLIVAFVMLVLGGVLGYLGGHKTYDGAVDVLDQSVDAIDEMNSLNVNVADVAFKALANFYGGDANYDSASVTSSINSIKNDIIDIRDDVSNARDIFDYALPAFYGVCAAVTLFGFFSWFCGCGWGSMTMGMIASVFLILSWILFAVFWITGSLLDDTCLALSDYFYLDCMKQPGYTCPNDELTKTFKCVDIGTVNSSYAKAWNLLDTAEANGAGTNDYGHLGNMINKGYANPSLTSYNSYGSLSGITTAPAYFAASSSLCGDTSGSPSTVCTVANFGIEPYTTCATTDSFNNADSTLDAYIVTPITGNRRALCNTADSNTNQAGPQNTAQTVSSYTTTGLTSNTTSTNPTWKNSEVQNGASIGTCERACLNASATSEYVLDSLTNFGGNAMYRKFIYESFTSVYSESNQGYAKCSADIAWTDNTYVTDYAIYQNATLWMATYSAFASSSTNCVDSTLCTYTTTNGKQVIPWDSGSSAGTNPACYQAAALATTDIMFALSYIGSCYYIKNFALLTAVQDSGACFDLGDGLVFMIFAEGLVGGAFIILTIIGIMGYRRFDSAYDPANKKDSDSGVKENEDLYDVAGFDSNADAHDPNAPYIAGGGGTQIELEPGVRPQPPPAVKSSHDAWV